MIGGRSAVLISKQGARTRGTLAASGEKNVDQQQTTGYTFTLIQSAMSFQNTNTPFPREQRRLSVFRSKQVQAEYGQFKKLALPGGSPGDVIVQGTNKMMQWQNMDHVMDDRFGDFVEKRFDNYVAQWRKDQIEGVFRSAASPQQPAPPPKPIGPVESFLAPQPSGYDAYVGPLAVGSRSYRTLRKAIAHGAQQIYVSEDITEGNVHVRDATHITLGPDVHWTIPVEGAKGSIRADKSLSIEGGILLLTRVGLLPVSKSTPVETSPVETSVAGDEKKDDDAEIKVCDAKVDYYESKHDTLPVLPKAEWPASPSAQSTFGFQCQSLDIRDTVIGMDDTIGIQFANSPTASEDAIPSVALRRVMFSVPNGSAHVQFYKVDVLIEDAMGPDKALSSAHLFMRFDTALRVDVSSLMSTSTSLMLDNVHALTLSDSSFSTLAHPNGSTLRDAVIRNNTIHAPVILHSEEDGAVSSQWVDVIFHHNTLRGQVVMKQILRNVDINFNRFEQEVNMGIDTVDSVIADNKFLRNVCLQPNTRDRAEARLLQLSNNRCKGNLMFGGSSSEFRELVLRGNRVDGRLRFDGRVFDCNISENRVYGSVELDGGASGLRFIDNTLGRHNCESGAYLVLSSAEAGRNVDTQIEDTVITGNTFRGLFHGDMTRCMITNNVVLDVGSSSFGPRAGCTWNDCKLEGNRLSQFVVCAGATIKDSIISTNQVEGALTCLGAARRVIVLGNLSNTESGWLHYTNTHLANTPLVHQLRAIDISMLNALQSQGVQGAGGSTSIVSRSRKGGSVAAMSALANPSAKIPV